jgi:hypothetical protein
MSQTCLTCRFFFKTDTPKCELTQLSVNNRVTNYFRKTGGDPLKDDCPFFEARGNDEGQVPADSD